MKVQLHIPYCIILALIGCTQADLYSLDSPIIPPKPPEPEITPTVTVKGTYCAANAQQIISPVKILFIMDDSTSMNDSDGNFNRLTAAQTLINNLIDTSDYIFFGVERFSGSNTRVLTQPDFMRDKSLLSSALSQSAHQTVSGTPYMGALQEARSAIQRDMSANPANLERTRYVILFMSDGEPTDSEDAQILAAEQTILTLRQSTPPVGGITIHTAYLQDGPMPAQNAINLLMEMAKRGGGEFRNFQNGESIDFTDFDVTALSRDYIVLARAFVTNRSAILGTAGVLPDSDRDGLTDEREKEVGTAPLNPDTDGDGCGDFMEVMYEGYDPLKPGPHCNCTDVEKNTDSDGDGLNDCEEGKLTLNPKDPDSDVDAEEKPAPDYLIDSIEVLWKMARKSPDAASDYDGDGVNNLDELKNHMDPHTQDTALREDFAYVYEHDNAASVGRSCFELLVKNIHVAQTQAAEGKKAGDNVIQIIFAEAPQDNPIPERKYKILEAVVNSSNGVPTPAIVEFKPEDFREFGR